MLSLLISFLVCFPPTETFYPTKAIFPDKTVYTNTIHIDIYDTKIVFVNDENYYQKTFFIIDRDGELYLCKNDYLIQVHRYKNGQIRKISIISPDGNTLTLLKAMET